MSRVGHAPSTPQRLTRAEWIAAFKRTFKSFLADDCMGLSQQVAYSSLLAFFPAVVALVGLLDLIGAYDTLSSFLDPVAPKAVTDLIQTFQHDSSGGGSVIAFVIGICRRGVGGVGRDGLDRQGSEPRVRAHGDATVLEATAASRSCSSLPPAIATAGMLLLVVLGGTLGDAIARRRTSAARSRGSGTSPRWPIAFAAVLLFFGLVYYLAPNIDQPPMALADARDRCVGGLMWIVLSGLFALYTAFSNSYSKTYGALAGGIVLLLWLNYTAWAILFGAELNSELDRQADIHAAGGEHAGLTRPARRTR